jgi:hypothetical protein
MLATSRFLWFNIPRLAYLAFAVVVGVSVVLAVRRGRLLSIVAALSLLLCAATVVEWVPSYRRSHLVCWVRRRESGQHRVAIGLEFSRGIVVATTRPDCSEDARPGLHSEIDLRWEYGTVNRLGFGVDARAIYVPLWFVGLLTATPPAARALVWCRGAGRREGTCSQCGYDLRATPDRCPECGHGPERTAS